MRVLRGPHQHGKGSQRAPRGACRSGGNEMPVRQKLEDTKHAIPGLLPVS